MPSLDPTTYPLARLADEVGTPFYFSDGRELAGGSPSCRP